MMVWKSEGKERERERRRALVREETIGRTEKLTDSFFAITSTQISMVYLGVIDPSTSTWEYEWLDNSAEQFWSNLCEIQKFTLSFLHFTFTHVNFSHLLFLFILCLFQPLLRSLLTCAFIRLQEDLCQSLYQPTSSRRTHSITRVQIYSVWYSSERIHQLCNCCVDPDRMSWEDRNRRTGEEVTQSKYPVLDSFLSCGSREAEESECTHRLERRLRWKFKNFSKLGKYKKLVRASLLHSSHESETEWLNSTTYSRSPDEWEIHRFEKVTNSSRNRFRPDFLYHQSVPSTDRLEVIEEQVSRLPTRCTNKGFERFKIYEIEINTFRNSNITKIYKKSATLHFFSFALTYHSIHIRDLMVCWMGVYRIPREEVELIAEFVKVQIDKCRPDVSALVEICGG